MDSLIGNLKSRIQFWAVLGPVILLASLLVILSEPMPGSTLLALLAVVGIPACWQWRSQGAGAATALIVLAVIFQVPSLQSSEIYWLVGLALSMTVGFFVSALCMDEVDSMLELMTVESKSRLDNLLRLDEKLRDTQEDSARERRTLQIQLQMLEEEVSQRTVDIELKDRSLEVLGVELDDLQGKRSRLLQEIYELREQSAASRAQLLPSQGSSDDSEDDAPRNRIGNVPLEWYKDEDHVGYDLEGQKIIRTLTGGEIDALLESKDNPDAWRTIKDHKNQREMVLTDTDLEVIRRIRSRLPQLPVPPFLPVDPSGGRHQDCDSFK